MGQPTSLHGGSVCGRRVREGTMLLAQLSTGFQSLLLLLTSKLGPSDADSQVSGCFLHSRMLWVSPVNSAVRLGVSPAASTPTGVFS